MQQSQHILYDSRHECLIKVGAVAETLPTLVASRRTIAIVDSAIVTLCTQLYTFDEVIAVESGEGAKTLARVEEIYRRLIELGADRRTLLVGIGGGTLTDIVGFVAATYMRGVDFVLIPTTLLGQVDAAIGGKCGVNLGGYKNMVGAFRLPLGVICDVSLLATLPEREWRGGMAEVIKSAIIGDAGLFELLEGISLEEIIGNSEVCGEIVARCIAVKCDIVRRDLLESGERRLLNLGHTRAHAIESLTRQLSHGEAVAVGITYAARMAVERGLLGEDEAIRIVHLLENYGLPTIVDLPEEALTQATTHDKKATNGTPRWVLPIRIGACIVE